MALENRQIIQHLRNGWVAGQTLDVVKNSITSLTGVHDGEIVLGRYGSDEKPQVVLGVYNASKNSWNFIKDAEQILADVLGGAREITNFAAVENVIKNILGTGYTGTTIADIQKEVKTNQATISDVDDRLAAMEATLPIDKKASGLTFEDKNYINGNGQTVQAVLTTLDSSLKDEETARSNRDAAISSAVGVAEGASAMTFANTAQFVSAETTIKSAIEALDTALQDANGEVASEVERLEGVLGVKNGAEAFNSDNTDKELTAYTVSATTTVASALNALGAAIDAMDYELAAANGKVLKSVKQVNGAVEAASDFLVDTDIKIVEVAEGNRAETSLMEYQLVNGNNDALGQKIIVPKDKSLQSVEMVSSWTETIDDVETEKTGYAFKFVYNNASGSTDIVYLDTQKLLFEAEFKSGVTANTEGVVHVVITNESEKVKVGSAETDVVAVLTETATGLKIAGIQSAIDYAVETASDALQAEVDAIEAAVGLTEGGKYEAVDGNFFKASSETTLKAALVELDAEVANEFSAVSSNIACIKQVIGIPATGNCPDTGMTAHTVSGKTVIDSLNALGAEIDGMDKSGETESCKLVSFVEQTNGKVSETKATLGCADESVVEGTTYKSIEISQTGNEINFRVNVIDGGVF